MLTLQKVYIVGAKRTPFGAFLGKLKNTSATELAVHASKAAISQLNNPEVKIDSCVFGNVCQTSVDAAYLARHVALYSGISIDTPALTVNRLCGSGFQSVINGVQEIHLGQSTVALCGGTENMSQSPHVLRGAREAAPYGKDLNIEDSLASALVDRYKGNTPMGITAENLAQKFGISRSSCDEYALQSQKRWATANKNGCFEDEIVPVELKTRKGTETLDIDEHPKPKTEIESLSKLRPVFKKEGVVTAGNASGISDGAAALVIASEEAVKKYSLSPLAEIIGYSVVGCEPNIMGYGPVPAINMLLKKLKMKLGDADYVEVNEAFASQFLTVQKELALDMNKTNVNGGAIALGHPLGASGSRILAHLTYLLKNNNKELAIGSACIGGGQGISIAIRNCGK